MGPLVTVNSATMVNKGLEVIEAHLLFNIPYDRIDVVIHPQQVIHSMVEFCDGSTIAQASPPDMHLPIALALAWPQRLPDVSPRIDWTRATTWEFEPVDAEKFPAVDLACDAGRAGGTHPAVFNAANETAVSAFLAGALPFVDIVPLIRDVLTEHVGGAAGTLEAVLGADAWARARASELLAVR
ncbi:MAG: 1-deoxy-D-xylulose-5-phosphate reductoisomerase, partial [Actinobacteria bacterium]|nr:1-deoxy-D-xylulose-5-phosphate reductoisomerase [Actinomycetota bacterium]